MHRHTVRHESGRGRGAIRYASSVLRDRLVERLLRVEGLVAAYLFGSHARGDFTAASDVDVAVWLHAAPKTLDELPLELAAELQQTLGVPVDVVVMNGAPTDLIHRILRDGILLVDRNPSARIAFEVRARNDYFDLLPVRNAYRHRRGGAGA
jgi:predicted nucleotidyltransferase